MLLDKLSGLPATEDCAYCYSTLWHDFDKLMEVMVLKFKKTKCSPIVSSLIKLANTDERAHALLVELKRTPYENIVLRRL